jgi:hypothetical protein
MERPGARSPSHTLLSQRTLSNTARRTSQRLTRCWRLSITTGHGNAVIAEAVNDTLTIEHAAAAQLLVHQHDFLGI